MASTQDNVLNGNSPLTRSSMSGGILSEIYRKPKDRLEAWRFGSKVRLYTFGTRREPIEMVFDRYFLPIGRIETSFNKFFDFYKKARKEDLKAQGRTGIRGMFKEFMDFRVWKKIFGIARDPTVAALHQIRDILIDVYDPSGSKKYKARYGLDPQDPMMGIMNALPVFLKRYKKEGEENTSIFRAIRGFFKEVKGDQEALKKAQWQNLILNERKVDLDAKKIEKLDKSLKQQENISKTNKKNNTLQKSMAHSLSATAALTEESIKNAEFNRTTDEKKEIRQTKGKGILGGALSLGGMIAGGILGGGVGLLRGGLGGLLRGTVIGGASGGVLGSKAARPFMGAGARGLSAGLGTGMMAGDFLRHGMGEFSQGNIGQGIVKTLFGDLNIDKEPGENLSTSVRNMIKYGSFGFSIGGLKGLLAGAVLGLAGSGVTLLAQQFSKVKTKISSGEVEKEMSLEQVQNRNIIAAGTSKVYEPGFGYMSEEKISSLFMSPNSPLSRGGIGQDIWKNLNISSAFMVPIEESLKDYALSHEETLKLRRSYISTLEGSLAFAKQKGITDPKDQEEIEKAIQLAFIERLKSRAIQGGKNIDVLEEKDIIALSKTLGVDESVISKILKEAFMEREKEEKIIEESAKERKKIQEETLEVQKDIEENTRSLKQKIFGNIYYTSPTTGEKTLIFGESKAEKGT